MNRTVLVIGIIFLLIGASVVSSTGKIDTAKTNINDGNLLGYVNDTSGNPIEGALIRVHFHGTYEEDYSDSNGYYHVTNIPICKCYKNCTASKEGYKTEWVLLGIYENTTYDFILTFYNHPPDTPVIEGKRRFKEGEGGKYPYKIYSYDFEGHDVYYHIKWSDGMEEKTDFYPSGEKITITVNIPMEEGTYEIFKIKAIDAFGAESDWAILEVIVSRGKVTYNSLLLILLERFPLLVRFLYSI